MEEAKQDPKTDAHAIEHHTHTAEHDTHEHHAHEHVEHAKKHKHFNLASTDMMIVLIVVLVVICGLNAYFSGAFNAAPQQPAVQPAAKLQLVSITSSSCPLCFDISGFSSAFKQMAGVNVTSEKTLDLSSAEAQALVSKYSITKVPIVIITGEFNDSRLSTVLTQQLGQIKTDAFVMTEIPPPYFDISSSKVVGIVSFKAITDSTCKNCSSVDSIIGSFKQANVVFGTNTTYDYTWQEAKSIIGKYNITRLPAIIFSSDLGIYSTISSAWDSLGKIAADGSYVLTEVPAPFKDLTTGFIAGIVNVTYLYDSSCTACYNVSMHHAILVTNFKVVLGAENTYDVNSTQGKALVSKYNITNVPTFLMSPDAKYYSSLMQVWPTVGTNETDGWYVFRSMTALGNVTYKDLSTGHEVNATG